MTRDELEKRLPPR